VNVFVVDSGIDTTHVEFAPNGVFQRDVQNLYDRYVTVGADGDVLQGVVSDNNDYVGHGTHCAGTIGGNTVGVSPGANIYGVKVLSKQGDGSDFDILSGLSFVYKWHKAAVAVNKVGRTIHHAHVRVTLNGRRCVCVVSWGSVLVRLCPV
jgi:subtilisin family serine protease